MILLDILVFTAGAPISLVIIVGLHAGRLSLHQHTPLSSLFFVLYDTCCDRRARHELPHYTPDETGPSIDSAFPAAPNLDSLQRLLQPLRPISPEPIEHAV